MKTDQDLPLHTRSATAVFAANGQDVTTSRDQGVIKVPMSSWGTHGTLIAEGSLSSGLQVVKRDGVDGERPMIGDRVTIHYTGKLLSGKKFDCSRDRKESFSFHLGKGRWQAFTEALRKITGPLVDSSGMFVEPQRTCQCLI